MVFESSRGHFEWFLISSNKITTLPKFNSSPLKSYRDPKVKDRLPAIHPFQQQIVWFWKSEMQGHVGGDSLTQNHHHLEKGKIGPKNVGQQCGSTLEICFQGTNFRCKDSKACRSAMTRCSWKMYKTSCRDKQNVSSSMMSKVPCFLRKQNNL